MTHSALNTFLSTPDYNISSAIGFLERKFKVNYDQRNGADVDWKFRLSPSNHHFKSLSHSPDILGLFFSILDQFMNTSSFFANGKLVRIDTSSQELYIKIVFYTSNCSKASFNFSVPSSTNLPSFITGAASVNSTFLPLS